MRDDSGKKDEKNTAPGKAGKEEARQDQFRASRR
jgi:hypothetical protein